MKHIVFVTSIIVIIVLTGGVAYVGLTHLPPPRTETAAFLGSISTVDAISANEVRLTLDASTAGLRYDRCQMVIFSPDNTEVTTVDLETDRWSYMTNGERLTLTTVTMLDNDYDCEMDAYDAFSLYHTKPLELGKWTFRIFVDGNKLPSLEEYFSMPSSESTPAGAFRSPTLASSTELLVQFGIIDTAVPFYYSALQIVTPDGKNQTWEFQQGAPNIFSFNDTIWISIIDMGEPHIINYGDIVRVQSTSGPIPAGMWQFTLFYDHTDGEICHAHIDVRNGQAVLA
ncbi:MAG: hypothetical protein A4E32_01149 [Methanomassiliicoccales archaeon PtaU1.Bin124]|nr:MAG: hypothetical protein A4E32_01149 [Methanomassiliicoccales archaeon PtaU1.Bin124]